VRPIVEAYEPKTYVGVDFGKSKGVDKVVNCDRLVEELGHDYADVVISTEMMEHVRNWKLAMLNLAGAVRPGGVLVITTRSVGFPYHPFPEDHWRYTLESFDQMIQVLGFKAITIISDPEYPGVFVKAKRPMNHHAAWPGVDSIERYADELFRDVVGVTPVHEPLTVLGLPYGPDGSGYYRFYQPFMALAKNTAHRILIPQPGQHFYPDDKQLEEIDVVVGQRMCGATGIEMCKTYAEKSKMIWETDDNVLMPDPAGLPHLWDPKVRQSFIDCIRLSHMVTVSTEPLAEAMREYSDNVVVLPNHIHEDMLKIDRPRRERLTVGWAGGQSHLTDWSVAAESVKGVMGAHPEADMHFIGTDYSPLLDRRHRFTPWEVDIWEYYKTIDFDIGVAPLSHGPFNDAKSFIKSLEFAALGIPIICSDEPPYHDFVKHGETGFLVNNDDEWKECLELLIRDVDLREQMGKNAKELARTWTIQGNGWQKWLAAYEKVAGYNK
jgi:glycosyltransferase involved in cell wall biosynthesis